MAPVIPYSSLAASPRPSWSSASSTASPGHLEDHLTQAPLELYTFRMLAGLTSHQGKERYQEGFFFSFFSSPFFLFNFLFYIALLTINEDFLY